MHLHGSSWTLSSNGRAAVAAESGALVGTGQSVGYESRIPANEPEGTHLFHSHGPDERALTNHGLFGNVIVEPPASTWLDPRSGIETSTGWDAIVQTATGANFREFVLDYHEIGNENEFIVDRNGQLVPQVDPLTHAYRPDGRALNYRSEPFLNRLTLGRAATGLVDESLEYSSYTYGDPATPTMRSYLGDPVKQRVVHAGSPVFHVHHVHGGSIRWRRQPGVEPTRISTPACRSILRWCRSSPSLHRQPVARPVGDLRRDRRVRQRWLPAERGRLPLSLSRGRALLLRHVGRMARVRHAAGRHRFDRRNASAPAGCPDRSKSVRPAVVSNELTRSSRPRSTSNSRRRVSLPPTTPRSSTGPSRAACTKGNRTTAGHGPATSQRHRADAGHCCSIRLLAGWLTLSSVPTLLSGRHSPRTTAQRRSSIRLRPGATYRRRGRAGRPACARLEPNPDSLQSTPSAPRSH